MDVLFDKPLVCCVYIHGPITADKLKDYVDLTITSRERYEDMSSFLLNGSLSDQVALVGLVNMLHKLGMVILSLECQVEQGLDDLDPNFVSGQIGTKKQLVGQTEVANAVYNMVALCFAGKHTAAQILDQLVEAADSLGYKIVARAVVEVDDKGKPHVHTPGHGGAGAAAGAVSGGLLALVGGPAGLLVWSAVGGLVGGLAGKYSLPEMDRQALKELGEQMQPDTSAVLALVEDTTTAEFLNSVGGLNAQVLTITIGDQLSGEIAQAVVAEVDIDMGIDLDDK